MPKFFISYTSKDSQKAQWIGWTLKDLGQEVYVHEWEVRPGESIQDWMDRNVDNCDHLIGVFSPDYIDAPYSKSERQAAFWDDPIGCKGFFIPIVIRPCELPRMVRPLKRLDLTGCDQDEARAILETLIKPSGPPESEPHFEKVPADGHASEPEPNFEPTEAGFDPAWISRPRRFSGNTGRSCRRVG